MMYIGTIGILYHDVGIIMGIPVIISILRDPCNQYILGFCSMMNVYKIINFLSVGICLTFFNHGNVENHVFMYLGITPNADFVLPPKYVSCRLKFLYLNARLDLRRSG